MTEEQELIWDKEVDNLSESGGGNQYFTPEEGKQEIKFLDDGTGYRDQKKFDDEVHDYVKFQVEVDGEEMIWDMKKGSTPGSKFGQIARYAKKKDGLEGETVTWFRQGEGQQTNHILMDLDDLDEETEGQEPDDSDDEDEETLFGEDEED